MNIRCAQMILAFSITLALVLVACGGGTKAPSQLTATAPAGQAATRTPQPTTAPTPAVTAVPIPSGDMKVAFSNMGTFDMLLAIGTGRNYLDALYDYTIGASVDGKLDAKAGLATSWEMSPDGKTWTLKLRSDIYFHNGDQASAKDIVATIERSRADGSKRASATTLRREVVAMQTPDEATFIVRLGNPQIFWAQVNLSQIGTGGAPSYIEPKNYIEAKGAGGANRSPVGSGPYKFNSLMLDDRVVMEAVDKHWLLGVPRVKNLTYLLIPDENTRVSLLKTGDVDLIPLSRAVVSNVRGVAGLRVVGRDESGKGSFGLADTWVTDYPGYGKNPFGDARVRKALTWYGIDRDKIVRTFLAGYGKTAINGTDRVDPAYVELPVPAYDVEKAKALLKEAGYEKGFELDVVIYPRPALPEGGQIMEAIASWWEVIGLKVNRRAMDYEVYVDAQLKAKPDTTGAWTKPTAAGMIFLGNNAVNGASLTTNCTPPFQPRGGERNPAICPLADAWRTATSLPDYIKAGGAYQRAVYDNGVSGTVFTSGELFGATSKIPATWNMGMSPYAFLIERAATQR